jgi:hypothetical protein
MTRDRCEKTRERHGDGFYVLREAKSSIPPIDKYIHIISSLSAVIADLIRNLAEGVFDLPLSLHFSFIVDLIRNPSPIRHCGHDPHSRRRRLNSPLSLHFDVITDLIRNPSPIRHCGLDPKSRRRRLQPATVTAFRRHCGRTLCVPVM